MSNADRIGLPTQLGWLVSGPLAATIYALVLTPIGVYVIAFIFESRIIGKHFRPFKGAFRGFMPGDVFLGTSFGQFVWQFKKIDHPHGWWTNWWWQAIVAIGAVVVGYVIREKNDRPNYSPQAMRSPTKLYHDFIIYMGLGYVFATTAIAATLATGFDTSLVLPYGLLAGWVICLIIDGTNSKEELRRLGSNSHPSEWKAIWQ